MTINKRNLTLKYFKCPALYKGRMFYMTDETHTQIKVKYLKDTL